jgi:hypothetical protein
VSSVHKLCTEDSRFLNSLNTLHIEMKGHLWNPPTPAISLSPDSDSVGFDDGQITGQVFRNVLDGVDQNVIQFISRHFVWKSCNNNSFVPADP